MSAKNPFGIRIPSVFISEDAGLKIKENYLFRNNYFIVINSEPPYNINKQLLMPFAIVVGVCFIVMVSFMVSIFYCLNYLVQGIYSNLGFRFSNLSKIA